MTEEEKGITFERKMEILKSYLRTPKGRVTLAFSLETPLKCRWDWTASQALEAEGKQHLLQTDPEAAWSLVRKKLSDDPEWVDALTFVEDLDKFEDDTQIRQIFQVYARARLPEEAIFTFSPQWACLKRMVGTPEARQETAKNPEARSMRAYREWRAEFRDDAEAAELLLAYDVTPPLLDWVHSLARRRDWPTVSMTCEALRASRGKT